jgi:hypothetical protein
VLADTSKEGRTLSIRLGCLENVEGFGRAMLSEIGKRSRIESFTEIVLRKGTGSAHRPDGLLVIRSGSNNWSALVEAKIGNSELYPEQVEAALCTKLTLRNEALAIPA